MFLFSLRILKLLFIISLFYYSCLSFASSFYIACYYYDSDKGPYNKNSSLMTPSKLYIGANTNYFWALNNDNQYVKLNGSVIDGFFIEDTLSRTNAIQYCQNAVKKGTFLWPSKSTYKLLDFKAATSNFDGFEYPIRFLKDNNNFARIKQIVLFGDSLSDTGNLKRWTKYMPGYPGFFGRFTDFYNWIDFLADMQPNKGPKYPVLNFAYGGAKSDGTNDFYFKNLKNYMSSLGRNFVTGSSKDYINNYLNKYLTQDSYQAKSPEISNPNDILYVIWIGANDYISKLESPILTQEFFDNPNNIGGSNTVYKRSVEDVIEQINLLYNQGARHFLIINLPDFGRTPVVLDARYKIKDLDNPTDEANKISFSKKITKVIESHNKYLSSKIKDIEIINKEIDITFIDIFKGFNAFIDGKSIIDGSDFNYGVQLLNSKYPIPGTNKFIQEECYTGGYIGAAKALTKSDYSANSFALKNSCHKQNESEYDGLDKISPTTIFWNNPHPSSYAHCWISFMARKGLEDKGLIPKELPSLENYKNYCLEILKAKYN
ncbi:SGNH/GDSL hydrolase family protein [Fluviispira vulneris]|uniref:SGNH/GDSL hydrolase family protein n=1 Tax=Fluviispira vulneris TaxID=2763012 RepID=UPI001644C627|nr:SGNH/GDSL hydrolase family protein [Fluviispira vulneris]